MVVFQNLANPCQVFRCCISPRSKIVVVASIGIFQFGDSQICLNTSSRVAQGCVGHGSKLFSFHISTTQILHCLVRLFSTQEELPKIGLVKKCYTLTSCTTFLCNGAMTGWPIKSKLSFDQIQVFVFWMLWDVWVVLLAQSPGAFLIGTIVVITFGFLQSRQRCFKPARALEAMSSLINTAAAQQLIIQSRLATPTTSQGLIVREDDGISLGITLMRPVFHPSIISDTGGMETRTIEAEEIDFWRPCENPLGHFPANPTSQHQAHRVETTS
mmetsp:Transcript_26588/g.58099  ORF Transcript_26588/g.58099 Transcript_26588/m.58099 type:complete len:271 (+) Transcript_26588:978-1790(+)